MCIYIISCLFCSTEFDVDFDVAKILKKVHEIKPGLSKIAIKYNKMQDMSEDSKYKIRLAFKSKDGAGEIVKKMILKRDGKPKDCKFPKENLPLSFL